MSQKKVEQYKEYKKNRDKIIAKEKRSAKLWRLCGVLLAVVVVGWIGFSIYNSATRPSTEEGEVATVEWDLTDYIEYLGAIETPF